VASCAVALVNGRLTVRWTPYATVSMHAPGRWFERTSIRDHAMLVRDLAILALAPDEGDHVPTLGAPQPRCRVSSCSSRPTFARFRARAVPRSVPPIEFGVSGFNCGF
jgi:hypothetical protein